MWTTNMATSGEVAILRCGKPVDKSGYCVDSTNTRRLVSCGWRSNHEQVSRA